MAFVGDSTTGQFFVGQERVGTLDRHGPVPSVYPPGFIKSIAGGVISGDGHVALGVPSGQFGTPIFRVTQSRSVNGVGSAQSFGTFTFKTVVVTTLTGLGSAQNFGSLRFRVTLGSGGVLTAQAFGTIRFALTRPVIGVGSAQAFGAITTRTGRTIPVGGVASAQSFGAIKLNVWIAVGGVPSAQAFGALTFHVTVSVLGLGSAQQFGLADVYIVWLHPPLPCVDVPLDALICIASPDDSICGFPICGDGHVCGGMSFSDPLDCLDFPMTALDATLLDLDELAPITLDLLPVGCE